MKMKEKSHFFSIFLCVVTTMNIKSYQTAYQMKGNFVLVSLTPINDSLSDKTNLYAINTSF